MDKIKYWFYYFDNKLYAYTDNKERAIEFEQERDMTQFKRKKKNITKKLVNSLARDDELRYLYLIKMNLNIYNKDTLRWMDGSLITTMMEKITVENVSAQLMSDTLFNLVDWNVNPSIFKHKIYKALDDIGYVHLYNQMTVITDTGEYEDGQIKIEPDELGIFLHYFGKTMKGGI